MAKQSAALMRERLGSIRSSIKIKQQSTSSFSASARHSNREDMLKDEEALLVAHDLSSYLVAAACSSEISFVRF
jgi:hypothetical protein